jgi:arginine deiminase
MVERPPHRSSVSFALAIAVALLSLTVAVAAGAQSSAPTTSPGAGTQFSAPTMSATTSAPQAQAPSYAAPFVTSDTATLRAVIVFPLDEYIYKSSAMGQGMPFFSMGQPPGVIAEYRAMIDLLKLAGVEVLDVRELLQEAIDAARRDGTLDDAMREIFPGSADGIVARLDEIDADSLLFLRDDHVYMDQDDGGIAPLFPGFSSLYWARDWAATTPKGVVIGNSRRFTRSLENRLAKFLFAHADRLRDFPVVFDAGAEGVNLDGGDLIVFDQDTILLGVDNRTSREAAPALARKLDMDVIAVALPSWDERTGLSRQLLHLDTTFNLVDHDTIVTTPYFHENRYAEGNPVARMLGGLAKQAEAWNAVNEADELNDGNVEYIRRTIEQMPEIGKLTLYAAGSGEERALDDELVDVMRDKGYRVVYVGGERGDQHETQWAIEHAMYELRYQGANVVQLGPGRVIAFEHNVATNQALRDAGIDVFTFPGELISMRGGGPHCLLMPLVRRD